MQNILVVIHLVIVILLIGSIMMQRSEGGALGIGGGTGNIFSGRGAGNALTRLTAILAAGFFVTSITLALMATRGNSGSVLDSVFPTQQQAPAVPAQPDNSGLDKLMPKLDGSTPAPADPAAPVKQ